MAAIREKFSIGGSGLAEPEVWHVKISKVEQADGKGWGSRGRKALKVRKRRLERRRANADPECQPAYTKYKGWYT